jgi:hypothetical protein
VRVRAAHRDAEQLAGEHVRRRGRAADVRGTRARDATVDALRAPEAVAPGDLPGIIVVGAVTALAGIIAAQEAGNARVADRRRPSASSG